jgi:SAM-dependent methyltransferase
MDETEAVTQHYEGTREEDRLTEGVGQLELVRTQEILRRFLPSSPGRVLDIGGGPGVYARWLAENGYQVHLVDPAPRHVHIVEAERGRGVTAEIGDARSLTQSDNTFDAALLLGPLYHLTDRADRLCALSEAARVVRPGGVVVAAAISRFASLFDGLTRGFLFDTRFQAIVGRDLRDGQHRNPTNEPHWFTTAFLHHPDELETEVAEAGLDVIALLGVEGFAGWLGTLGSAWSDTHMRETILFSARATEAEPSLRGLSAHMLAIGTVRSA